MGCSRSVLRSMLSGMFDGDGHSSKLSGTVGYTSISEKLIQQLRVLLLNFGMITKTSIDNRTTSEFHVNGKNYISPRKKSWQLLLSTTDSKRFYDLIGFKIDRKQSKSEKLHLGRQRCMLPKVVIDKVRELVRESAISKTHADKMTIDDGRKHGLQMHNILKRKSGITTAILLDILDAYKDVSHLNSYKYLRDRCFESVGTVWLPIKNIENLKSSMMMDVRVPKSRSYIANGIISSNSQIAKTVILAHIKKETRDKKNSTPYSGHLNKRHKYARGPVMERFLVEANEMFKYNDEYLRIVHAVEALGREDRPHDGFIGRLSKKTKLSKAKISAFIKLLRLRSHGFTDSGINDGSRNIYVRHSKRNQDDNSSDNDDD